jgi:hypothetical protein
MRIRQAVGEPGGGKSEFVAIEDWLRSPPEEWFPVSRITTDAGLAA